MSEALQFTIGGLLQDTARRFPENDALVYPDLGMRLSYREFDQLTDRVAKGLFHIGIRKGDHVSIWANNVPEWVVLQFATAKVGAVLVTVNTSYKSAELEYILRQSDSTTLFLVQGFKDTDYIESLYTVIPELKKATPGDFHCETLPFLKNVVFLGEERHEGMLNYCELEQYGAGVCDEVLLEMQKDLHPEDVINMQYTSGTTGFPKGVMLTHLNIINNGYNIGRCMDFSEHDRLCIPVPFFHCFGCVLGVLACVSHGATMVPVETFEPETVLRTVEVEKCTALHGVPTMFIAELEHPDFKQYDLSSLRTGIMAGSPCPIEVMKQVISDMNCTEITIAYGQTEASPVITQTRTRDEIDLRVSSVGRALPDVEVKIVDVDSGATLPAGEQGELCTRGYLVMQGYYKLPQETAEAIDEEGWLHTGDLAVMNEEGYCHITGRIKNMIIRGGENIYPREIEEFLYTHPKVSDVQVFGVPDKKYGERVMAAVKLREGITCTPEEIRGFCHNRIANHKIPHYVKFVDEYPMTASGKVQIYKLREMAVREYKLEDAATVKTA